MVASALGCVLMSGERAAGLDGSGVALDAALIKARARELGFDLCGIAKVRALERASFDRWYANDWDARLAYMRARIEERLDPRLVLSGAESVIVVAASYGPSRDETLSTAPSAGEMLSVARYAQGRDYHNVLLKRVRKLAAWMREMGARVYAEVDTGAVAEKAWAMESGLGWIGKNGLLIHEKFGSWLLLGALVTDLVLDADARHPDRCGECSACIPACPTNAIQEGRLVDSNRCLAFHTIETRAPIPRELATRAGGRVFGCDACQDACPWNRRAREGTLVELRARPRQKVLALEDVLAFTDASVRADYVGTPLMRAQRDGLVRAALAVCKRPLTGRVRELATTLLEDSCAAIREEAQRALEDDAATTGSPPHAATKS